VTKTTPTAFTEQSVRRCRFANNLEPVGKAEVGAPSSIYEIKGLPKEKKWQDIPQQM